MTKVKLVQRQLNAVRDAVVDTTTIGEFTSEALAKDFLLKRGFKFDSVHGAWIHLNAIQYPVDIVEQETSVFDIRSFV